MINLCSCQIRHPHLLWYTILEQRFTETIQTATSEKLPLIYFLLMHFILFFCNFEQLGVMLSDQVFYNYIHTSIFFVHNYTFCTCTVHVCHIWRSIDFGIGYCATHGFTTPCIHVWSCFTVHSLVSFLLSCVVFICVHYVAVRNQYPFYWCVF